MSKDALFESVSSNLARKVKLCRQDTVVGHKRLIYAIDLDDNTSDSTRNEVTNFLKNYFGFLQSEIEFVDRTKFEYNEDGKCCTKFTDDEQKKLNDSARRIF